MELSINIENFEVGEARHAINSPRTMEACLRVGVDPAELYARKRGDFASKDLNKDMVKIKYQSFEKKRQEKIMDVKNERNAIITFAIKKANSQPNSPSKPAAAAAAHDDDKGGGGLIEQEEKRMEALRRRQETELNKIMEREKALAEMHAKTARVEAEELKKQKEHAKHVLLAKADKEKKDKQRAKERAAKEQEEEQKKKDIARKEAQFAEKLLKMQMEEAKRIEKEAKLRDLERKAKMEEYKRKTAELIQMQADQAEANRLTMLEREQRVQQQIVDKKVSKAAEVADARARAAVRIEAALHKHHEMHEQKKKEFDEAQGRAAVLLQEKEKADRIAQREALDAREKRNTVRYQRLVGSFNRRMEHRQEIVEHMQSKDGGYDRITAERMQRIAMDKFANELKLSEKQENVQRTARQMEFKRLQTLKRIQDADRRYEDIQGRKGDLMTKYRAEQKRSLTRKHYIADAMELMKVTGDAKILDKIFAEGKSKGATTQVKEEDEEEKADDKRLAATA